MKKLAIPVIAMIFLLFASNVMADQSGEAKVGRLFSLPEM